MSAFTRQIIQLPAGTIAPVVPTGCMQRVSDTLPVAVQRIVDELDPEKIILFGAFAQGTATPDSDVDLLVISIPASAQPMFTDPIW